MNQGLRYTFWEKAGWLIFSAGLFLLLIVVGRLAPGWKMIAAGIISAVLMITGSIIIKGGWNTTRERWREKIKTRRNHYAAKKALKKERRREHQVKKAIRRKKRRRRRAKNKPRAKKRLARAKPKKPDPQ